jgi:hypothetical protein
MGIKPDVRTEHLAKFPDEESWLTPFLAGFDVTWARRRKAYNTDVSQYFLKPHDHIQEAFGFEQELMLVYSPYLTLEPRSVQAAEQLLQEEPARGRVERLTYLIVSDMPETTDWVKNYVSANQETRLIAAFSSQGLRTHTADAWYVRNELGKQFYGRDLFDFRLPLEHDTYFFGRDAEVLAYRDAIRRGENRGLFGLRKTGKTSFLFKVERVARREAIAKFLYLDCQSPDIRTLRWYELVADLTGRLDRPGPKGETPAQVTKRFNDVVKGATGAERVVLVFDEIEHISPLAKQDTHWHQDFVSFWQTIRACQTRHRHLSFILAGVNPSVTEVSQYGGIPNPLFGIVSPQYLRGLAFEDLKRMVKTLGKRMGLSFKPDAIEYLHARYGGHPLLTRIACSLIHTAEARAGTQRPVILDRARLVAGQAGRDAELSFYCEHVVSELRQFYEDEYAMLELLSRKQVADFAQLAQDGMGTSNDTPEFAVTAIAEWWEAEGRAAYPEANEVLVLADCGGTNGHRHRAWKLNLQEKLCDGLGLTVTVCHYPPGCSKWNPVEHRLFSQISTNWAGKPLRSLDLMLGYIRGTTTRTGLTVTAKLDETTYKKGRKVAAEGMSRLRAKHHDTCSDWNYTLSPNEAGVPTPAGESRSP